LGYWQKIERLTVQDEVTKFFPGMSFVTCEVNRQCSVSRPARTKFNSLTDIAFEENQVVYMTAVA
jgi:hypothetical protein